MTICDKLGTLVDAVLDVKNALEERGLSVGGSSLTLLADKTGCCTVWDEYKSPFNQLGYTEADEEAYAELTPDMSTFADDMNYSMSVKSDSEPLDSYSARFMDDTRLKYAPCMPTGGWVDDFSDMFRGCENLVTVPSVDLSSATNLAGMFCDCMSLENPDTGDWYLWNVTNMSETFENCVTLTKLDLSNVDLSNVEDMSYCFYNCGALDVLKLISFGACEYLDAVCMFDFCESLGASEEGLEALRDTLINDSFDRMGAGYDDLTISLPSAVRARLTEDELAEITYKGFTIA